MKLALHLLGAASLLLVAVAAAGGGSGPTAQAQIAVRNQGYIPFSDAPIFYRSDVRDPVALLQKRLDEGKVRLAYEDGHGYLKSTLDLLDVPVDSQTLVFSKTSFQHTNISPEHPRALYYNDDVYVGVVHDGDALEIISFDPMQGAIFYVLDAHKSEKPTFQRAELDCTQCHIAPGTRGIPGVLLRSIYPTRAGGIAPRSTAYITDQKSPLSQRWGGWYVTGDLAGKTMANAAVPDANPTPADYSTAPKPPVLSQLGKPFDASAYLVPTSDHVALLVLGHQTQMHNLITLTNYQTRLALHAWQKESGGDPSSVSTLDTLPEKTRQQIVTPAEQLLRYMLFVNETAPGGVDPQKIISASPFARQFEARGVRDSKKRSLRDLDLQGRTFRQACIHTPEPPLASVQEISTTSRLMRLRPRVMCRTRERRHMNFQQLRYVREAVRSNLNLTEASNTLNTSQSGVSKQIRELEIELGVEIFIRRGKRLTGLTRAGEGAVKIIERVLLETENLKRHASQFASEEHGRLVIATTHNQARYTLPAVITAFVEEFPEVQLELRQSTPRAAAQSVIQGEADIAIATEALDQFSELATFPSVAWRHVVVAPPDHPLADAKASLEEIATFPLITYSPEFSGRSQIDAAFAAAGLEPDIRLAAMDSDVIKTYVARGLGLGVVAEMAVLDDPSLIVLYGSRGLFPEAVTKVAVQRGTLLRGYAYRFIELLAPHLKPDVVRDGAIGRVIPFARS